MLDNWVETTLFPRQSAPPVPLSPSTFCLSSLSVPLHHHPDAIFCHHYLHLLCPYDGIKLDACLHLLTPPDVVSRAQPFMCRAHGLRETPRNPDV